MGLHVQQLSALQPPLNGHAQRLKSETAHANNGVCPAPHLHTTAYKDKEKTEDNQ